MAVGDGKGLCGVGAGEGGAGFMHGAGFASGPVAGRGTGGGGRLIGCTLGDNVVQVRIPAEDDFGRFSEKALSGGTSIKEIEILLEEGVDFAETRVVSGDEGSGLGIVLRSRVWVEGS